MLNQERQFLNGRRPLQCFSLALAPSPTWLGDSLEDSSTCLFLITAENSRIYSQKTVFVCLTCRVTDTRQLPLFSLTQNFLRAKKRLHRGYSLKMPNANEQPTAALGKRLQLK